MQPYAPLLLHPLQQRGHDASLGHDSPRPSGAGRPLIDLGDVTNLWRATSLATVDGAQPRERAIALHESPLSSPRSMSLRSDLVSLPYELVSLPYDLSAGGLAFLVISDHLRCPRRADSRHIDRLPNTQRYMSRWVLEAFR